MEKFTKRVAAELLFAFHCALFVIVVFGWLMPQIHFIYMAVLTATLLSYFAFEYCILSKWEFSLRKSVDPHVDYDHTFASYYTRKLFNGHLSNNFYNKAATIFIIVSLAAGVYSVS